MSASVEAASLVDLVIDRLADAYVFPERSARAAALLRARREQGAYDLPLGPELCERINADLLAASDDRHLRLLWHAEAEAGGDEAQLVAGLREQIRRENYGVRQVQRLSGNIGLIELTIIPEASSGGPTLAAAMQLVAQTDALILDLRATRGGSPDGVVLLASHLVADDEARLSDFVEGPNGPVRQYWTSAYVPGPRYVNRPVFVLTSGQTFSGGEALAYDLQALGRATIVGETTRGGAHPSEIVALTDQIELRLPVARPVNPFTGTNWEGVGVRPDVPTASADALEAALKLATETVADVRI